MDKKPQIFLSYASEDREQVKEIYHMLKAEGFKPWMDKEDLLPGQNWDHAIRNALRASDFVMVFFSAASVSKRGYVQKEYKLARDVLDELPEGKIFVIPVRLSKCEIPARFESLHCVDLDDVGGFDKIVAAINTKPSQEGSSTKGLAGTDAPEILVQPGHPAHPIDDISAQGALSHLRKQKESYRRENARALIKDALDIAAVMQDWAKTPGREAGRLATETLANVTFDKLGYENISGVYTNENGRFDLQTTLHSYCSAPVIPSGRVPMIYIHGTNEKTGNHVCVAIAGPRDDDIGLSRTFGYS